MVTTGAGEGFGIGLTTNRNAPAKSEILARNSDSRISLS